MYNSYQKRNMQSKTRKRYEDGKEIIFFVET